MFVLVFVFVLLLFSAGFCSGFLCIVHTPSTFSLATFDGFNVFHNFNCSFGITPPYDTVFTLSSGQYAFASFPDSVHIFCVPCPWQVSGILSVVNTSE